MSKNLLSSLNSVIVPLMLAAVAALATGCANTAVTPDIVVEPTFSSIQANVFSRSCSSSSCHSSGSQRGGLVLEEGKSYAKLINVPATNIEAERQGLIRVVPGNPDSSFLIAKLTGPGPGLGDRMPYASEGLNAQAIEAIRTWIKNGAKQD